MVGFAHRGAPAAHQRENTLAAFQRALSAGVGGLESDVWLTSDGVPALHHNGVYGPPWRRRHISGIRSDDLPAWLPTLPALYAACGTGFELSLDIKEPAGTHRAAVRAVLDAARTGGGAQALGRMWLCGGVDELRMWREFDDHVRLVNSTSLRAVRDGGGIERYAATLAAVGVAALNIRAREWRAESAPMVRVLHESGVLAFGWDAQSPWTLSRLRRFEVDGAYCDHVARLVRVTGEQRSGGGAGRVHSG
jgi:glycerophosphoryl diester phosphodiesterase